VTAHFLHGFNVSDRGRGSTDTLVPYFRRLGFATRQHDYGWFGLLQVRLRNEKVAAKVAKAVKPGDIGVGHSNGCEILARAADLGAPFAGLVLIHPALEADREIAHQVGWIDVYHGFRDAAVQVSELLDWMPWNWGRAHPWGDMGNRGYLGTDPRVANINDGMDHSGIFTLIKDWGPIIASRALRRSQDLRISVLPSLPGPG
jgi:hypothetical protein